MVRLRSVAAAVVLALCTAGLAAAGGGLQFNGPTIKNPTVPPLFVLRDQDGHKVALAQQEGRVVLVTFLYTHCPDVCPLVAGNVNGALRALGPRRRQVRALAISVDPAGDTRASVRQFVRRHQLLPEFRYLTGPRAALRRLWAAYGVQSLKQAGGDRVDHTLYTLLLDRSLRGRVLYDSTATAADIEHDTRLLLDAKS